MNKLSIVILTYNRRVRLLNQLRTLYDQPEIGEVSIEILDNHSNYDVHQAIVDEFGEERVRNLHVTSHPMNLGMHANLALPFFHCQSEWLWTLSDDDETEPDSLKTIFEDISKYPNIAVFKYQINTADKDYPDMDIYSLPELIDFYLSGKSGSGHLIFLSNNVYNTRIAVENYGSTLSHCYSCIAQILPMFHILDNKSGVVKMRSKQLVKFVPPEPGTGYPYLNTAVEISSTVMFKFNLTNDYYRKLGFLVTNGFAHYRLILCALEYEDKKRGRFLYEQVYSRSFRYSGCLIDKLYHLFYYFCYYTHFKISFQKALNFRIWMKKYFKDFR